MRHIKGIEVFKDVERKALELSAVIRGDAKRRARENASSQMEMFGGRELPETEHLAQLQAHFETQAAKALQERARLQRDWPYDELYAVALRFPTVQEAFLKHWLRDRAEFSNLGDSRSPKIRHNHRVRFCAI